MKPNLIISVTVFLLLCGFKPIETSITITTKKNITYLTIFPNKDDTSFYIKREFDREHYCREEVFKNGKRAVLTTFSYYKNHVSYDEIILSNEGTTENILQIKENYDTEYSPLKKTFPIHDSTSFVIYYYKDGYVQSFGLETSSCKSANGFELNETNTNYSTGKFSSQITKDTTIENIDGVERLMIRQNCNTQRGKWYKYDFDNNLIDSTKY